MFLKMNIEYSIFNIELVNDKAKSLLINIPFGQLLN